MLNNKVVLSTNDLILKQSKYGYEDKFKMFIELWNKENHHPNQVWDDVLLV